MVFTVILVLLALAIGFGQLVRIVYTPQSILDRVSADQILRPFMYSGVLLLWALYRAFG